MRWQFALGVLLSGWLGVAHAQTPPGAPASPPPAGTAGATSARLQGADAQKLLGRAITNAQNEKIGEIKSIHLDRNGVVDAVIVSVGGFLGIGDREVALAWKDLQVSANGEKVSTSLTRDQLQALPAYRYAEPRHRGTVFRDEPSSAEGKPPTTAPGKTAEPAPPSAPPSRAGFNTGGDVSGAGLVRAAVRNPAGESIGEVEEVVLSAEGKVKHIIVSVGGFLGVGTKRVAMKWSDFRIWQDKDRLTLVTEVTKDDLKAAPDYRANGQ